MVSIALPATLTRKKLAASIANSQARSTRFGSVSGWNSNQFDSKFQAFVSQEDTQLIERPTISSTSLFFATRFPVQVIPDASQIFYSYYFFIISSRLDNAIANRMVEPSLKSSLLTRQPFQKFFTSTARTSRAFTSLLLKSFSQVSVMVAQLIYCVGIPIVSFTRISNGSSAQVNPQTLIRIICFRWFGFNLNLDVILSRLPFNQCGRSWRDSTQQMSLVIANQQWEKVSSVFQRQLNRPVIFVKAKYSCIISRAGGLEFFNWTPFKLRTFAITGHPRNRLTDQVSWKFKQLFRQMVNFFMDSQSTRNFWVNCRVDPVTAISKALKRGINLLRQNFINPKLATNCKHLFCHLCSIFHTCIPSQLVSAPDPALFLRAPNRFGYGMGIQGG